MISMHVDYGELWATVEAMESVTKQIDSRRFKKSAFNALTGAAAMRFNMWLDSQAEKDPDELWHVYEWGQIAEPRGRLFKMVFESTGPLSARSMWKFTESTVVVPKDSRLGDKQSDHIFAWKAYAFEYGLTMTVATRDASRLMWWDDGVKASASPTRPTAASGDLAGNFTRRWTDFWGSNILVGSVIAQVEEPFKQFVEADVKRYVARVVGRARKASTVAALKPPLGTVTVSNQGRPAGTRVKTEQLDITSLLAKWGKSWQ